MKGSLQQYHKLLPSISNAYRALYNQMSQLDTFRIQLHIVSKKVSDTFSMQIALHSMAVVGSLSSNSRPSEMDLSFLCDIMNIKDISNVYSDVIEHNRNYFSSGDIPSIISDIVELDKKFKDKSISANLSDLLVNAVVEWFETLGKVYIYFFETTPANEELFYDYVKRMHDYLNELSIEKNASYNSLPEETSTVKESSCNTLSELKNLIGLHAIKHDVDELISLARMNKMRTKKGLQSIPLSLHLVFTGNPGTGKTTVARILAKLYNEIGILSRGQLVAVERSDLVAGYVGQTAIKTAKKIDEALGGILFIDEAYTLAKGENDFGQEAIDTILKAMEDHRDDLIVIVAGYQKPMETFINSNPGLKSRFNKYFQFPDYSKDELLQIFMKICSNYDYTISNDALASITEHIATIVDSKPENFANAREIRNYFETIVANQALRLSKVECPSQTELLTIITDDLC